MIFPNKPSSAGAAKRRWHYVVSPIKALSLTAQFLSVGAVGGVGAAGLGQILVGGAQSAGVLIGTGFYVLSFVIALLALRKSYPHDAIGFCNTVTVLRLMLVSVLLAALVTPTASPWAMFAVAALAFLLDGLDGWLARREGYVSAFGARFDIEVDSVLALVLALSAYQSGTVGAYVIVLGLPRYLFLIAQYPFPWLIADLPQRFSRKVVCVLQLSVLTLLIMPVIRAPLADIAAGIAALALMWSFWKDVRWLWLART